MTSFTHSITVFLIILFSLNVNILYFTGSNGGSTDNVKNTNDGNDNNDSLMEEMKEMKQEDILEKEQEAKDALNQRIHHLTARIIVTSGILPSIRNWKNLHLLSSDR